jgi:hypothetical protein
MMFFSDAVLAIAITLLVIEIEVPQLPHGASNSEHLAALANLTPHFIGYVISFAVIGVIWTGHHRAFSLALHFAPGLYLPNLALGRHRVHAVFHGLSERELWRASAAHRLQWHAVADCTAQHALGPQGDGTALCR